MMERPQADVGSTTRGGRLRSRLLLLAVVSIVPLALVCGFALRELLHQQLSQTEQASLDLTRALASAVDNELRLTVSALQALALTDAMGATDPDELAQAHALAVNVLASRPEWRAVLLVKPSSGEVVFNTGWPFGQAPTQAVEPDSLADALRTGAPVVGSLSKGPSGNYGVPIRVPVLREGGVRYVLTAILRPEAMMAVVNRQRVPDDWIVAIFDSHLMRVARSRGGLRFLATPPSESLRALIATLGEHRQVFGPTDTTEGTSVHTAVARLDSANWIVALGVPTSVGERAMQASLLAYGGGILLSVLLGGWAAWRVSRGIERPIERLREAALALGRGEPFTGPDSSVREIQAMSDALVAAGQLRARSEAERESLLAGERLARTAAEQAQQRLQLLVGAGSLLSQSLEESRTLEAIAALIVPSLADACRIDLLDAQGVLQRKITHHVDPVRQQAIARFVSQSVAPPDTPGTFPWTVKTGQSFLASFAAPGDIPTDDPGVREFARIVGIRSVFVVPLIARGQTLGAMAVMQAESGRTLTAEDGALFGEIAQRAALALDNVRLFAESRAALREASVANRAKDEFLAMLGHEMRNPLAPIVNSLEAMARRDHGVAAPERQVIERQVRHLSRLVDDLLDVSRIASGKVELQRGIVDLHDVVARARELTQPALQQRAALRVVAPAEPLLVHGDATRLTQIVCNLLVNAAKFSERSKPITVHLERIDKTLQLTVRDEGIGMSEALLPRIFDRFVQGDQALHRAAGGLGLGLAIARNLAELHGGAITASSAGAAQGSSFVVTLPAADTAQTTLSPNAPATAPAKPMRVLIVDDNVDAAQSLALLLELEGHEVLTAASGDAALELLGRFTPKVALLDIGLPHMDGYELARTLRADARWREIHLVALTGYGRDTDVRRAMEAGFDVHLVKPAEIDRVLDALAPFGSS